ncbi:cysteine desulfurase family protein [Jiulongibacter sediminis]|uniref:Cysteine desulfurase n=1 Tax=Jiulongibacter sediminis TaxID=1605367 RepID=A0A0P7BD80_9BACT|nr:cysteine desulfurase family protein [Jiulongibacter sediminis]KPM48640.1 cysteine desulfurase [Jiulongibacter sediminis]TBX25177.1 cysteine desulfurase [Jiulongibacter sediminis]
MQELMPIYLDYAATTPVDPLVMEKMLPWFTSQYGNAASRFHAYGWLAEEAVDEARKSISKITGYSTKEIIFTSGATEAINLALKGFFEAKGFEGSLITPLTEHKATLDTAEYLQSKGVKVHHLPVNTNGEIDLEQLDPFLEGKDCLLSVMQVNNETGVILPVKEIIELAHQKGAKVHVDATQAVGKLPFLSSADMTSFSAHKIYGPKGVGVLLCKKEVELSPQIHGGRHQRNRRSGTLNVSGIVGVSKALQLAESKREAEFTRLKELSSRLENALLTAIENAEVNAAGASRVPGISSICFKGLDGEDLLMRMTKIAVSNGSACNSASTEPSYVLRAMGKSEADAFASVRFSLGRFTTEMEIEKAVKHVIETVNQNL